MAKTTAKVTGEKVSKPVKMLPTKLIEVPVSQPRPFIDLGKYSKLIAALAGNIIAILLAWLAVQFPQIASCSIGPDGTDACTVFGMFTQAQITAALMVLINSYFVWQAPANNPPN